MVGYLDAISDLKYVFLEEIFLAIHGCVKIPP